MGQPHRDEVTRLGVIGLGVISRQYFDTLADDPAVRITVVADLDEARSRSVAAELGATSLSVADALASPDVDAVLNLTIPAAHAEIVLAAIAHGKDVYGEKPLAATLEESQRIMAAAGAAGVRVGCAPDTVLGTGIQTARAAVDAGAIGRPVSATATWISPGHESWHPNPDFYYLGGGGPLLDMGPYYVTSLVHLLGPVVSVVGTGSRLRDRRVIATGPRAGEEVPVQVLTHVAGVLEHAGGALSTITVSFDGVRSVARPIEVHGEEGSLTVPDPNGFDGVVELFRRGSDQWEPLPVGAGYEDAGRGVGLVDFLHAAPGDGRASGAMGLHVMEVMTGMLRSAETGDRVTIESTVTRPPLVPLTPAEAWRTP